MGQFSGEIKVASRIVDYLSSGLYNSPAACLKELVNNSYDADASRVDVFVRPDADRIVVSDDGAGLTQKEFEDHFRRVSESHKRDDSDSTARGRPKIGKIGIGFIAANELCDVMEIVSTKAGSTELLRVEVNFDEMRLDPAKRKREDGTYVKGDYSGVIGKAARDEHYTHVFLKRVKPTAQGILMGARKRKHSSGAASVYGLAPGSVCRLISGEAIANWGDLDDYSQAMLRVGLNVPVRYLPEWFPPEHADLFESLEREVAGLGFRVYCDGSDLRKPVVLPAGERSLARRLVIDGDHVAAHGYLYVKHGVLRPEWLNGVMIRIRNAAVGDYDRSFLGFKSSEGTLFQRWTTCEIWADDRLEDALNIDRRTLRETHPAYLELQEAFHDILSDFLKEARARLYTEPAAERRRSDARREVKRMTEVIRSPEAALPRALQTELRSVAKERASKERTSAPRDVRAVLRKFTVAELYELALKVARDTLPPREYEAFAKALAERLLR